MHTSPKEYISVLDLLLESRLVLSGGAVTEIARLYGKDFAEIPFKPGDLFPMFS